MELSLSLGIKRKIIEILSNNIIAKGSTAKKVSCTGGDANQRTSPPTKKESKGKYNQELKPDRKGKRKKIKLGPNNKRIM